MLSITILIYNVNRTIDKNYVSNKELFFEKYEVIKYGRVLSSLITPYNTHNARLFPFSSTNHTYLSIKTTVRNPFMAKIPRFLLSHNTSINTRRNAL